MFISLHTSSVSFTKEVRNDLLHFFCTRPKCPQSHNSVRQIYNMAALLRWVNISLSNIYTVYLCFGLKLVYISQKLCQIVFIFKQRMPSTVMLVITKVMSVCDVAHVGSDCRIVNNFKILYLAYLPYFLF